MKKLLMSFFSATITSFSLVAGSISPQFIQNISPQFIQNNDAWTPVETIVKQIPGTKGYCKLQTYRAKPRNEALRKEQSEGTDVTVHLKFNYDTTKFSLPYFVNYINDNIGGYACYAYLFSLDSANVQDAVIPQGTYDFVAVFSQADFTGSGIEDYIKYATSPEYYYVIKENIEIKDGMTIEFDPSTCTNIVCFNPVLPNGEHPVSPVARIDSSLQYVETEAPHNIEGASGTNTVLRNDISLESVLWVGGYRIEGQKSDNPNHNIAVNNVSERYHFMQERLMVDTNGKYYYVPMMMSGSKNDTVSNNKNDYLTYSDTFKHTPIYTDSSSTDYTGGIYFYAHNKSRTGIIGYSMRGDLGGDFTINYCPSKEANKYLDFEMNFSQTDYYQLDPETYDETIGDIFGSSVVEHNGELSYVNYGHHNGVDFYEDYCFDANHNYSSVFPGHPRYSYPLSQKKVAFGNNSPICSAMTQSGYVFEDDEGYALTIVKPQYIGRYNENRTVDNLTLTGEILHNDTVVCNDVKNAEAWAKQWYKSQHAKGKMEYKFINNNIDVDGISGKNVTDVTYDENNSDIFAPTLRMLQFSSTSNEITDRFESGQEGVLEFSCGDFSRDGIEVSAPASVKVEYAPYGSSDFFNLPVEEVPEYYYMPGLGYYYRGSLETVNAASPNGWFDLRITLTDSVGNMQRQVISPAFKVSSLTGIRDVALQNGVSIYAVQSMIYINGIDNPSVDIYDLSGRHMISTNGNHVDAGLAPGIYIVKASCGKTTQEAKVRIQ